ANPLHFVLLKQAAQALSHDQAVFQGVSGSRGRTRAVGVNLKLSVRSPRQVAGVHMQPLTTNRHPAEARACESGMPQHELTRDRPRMQQVLWAKDVFVNQRQQADPLAQTTLE